MIVNCFYYSLVFIKEYQLIWWHDCLFNIITASMIPVSLWLQSHDKGNSVLSSVRHVSHVVLVPIVSNWRLLVGWVINNKNPVTCPVALNKHPLSHVIFRKRKLLCNPSMFRFRMFARFCHMRSCEKISQKMTSTWSQEMSSDYPLICLICTLEPNFLTCKHHGIWKKLFEARYSTALHWSLTQFTPAAMEVTATNFIERLFSVFVVLAGAVCIASHRRFVSEDFELIAPFDDCKKSTHCLHR